MVGQAGGKPASWGHTCVLLKSQSSLGSFKTPIPVTALEGYPSEASADRKLGIPQLLGLHSKSCHVLLLLEGHKGPEEQQ